jgi:hypothetical protein
VTQRARRLAAQCGFWASYGAVHYLGRLPAITPDERPAIALASAVLAATGLVVSSAVGAVIAAGARRPHHEWLIAPLAAVTGTFAWMFGDRAALVALAGFARIAIPWDRFPRGFDLEYLFVMLSWTAGVLALRARERQRVLAEQVLAERVVARDAKLAAIAARLQPHFLFNALNTARSLAAEDPPRTRELLTRIADFLRYALAVDADTPVTVRDEFEAARTYLEIESARFEDALTVTIELEPAAESFLLPPFVLQPLLENAIRHADSDGAGHRWLRLVGSSANASLSIVVRNPGSLPAEGRSGGSGLAIARARLESLYGDQGSIELGGTDGVVTASVMVTGARQREP